MTIRQPSSWCSSLDGLRVLVDGLGGVLVTRGALRVGCLERLLEQIALLVLQRGDAGRDEALAVRHARVPVGVAASRGAAAIGDAARR